MRKNIRNELGGEFTGLDLGPLLRIRRRFRGETMTTYHCPFSGTKSENGEKVTGSVMYYAAGGGIELRFDAPAKPEPTAQQTKRPLRLNL